MSYSQTDRESYADTILAQRLRKAIDRLLPKLTSGKIRVKDAEKLVEEVM